jgi:hypothetical protein
MDGIFAAGNLAALLCWVALLVSLAAPRIRTATWRVTGWIAPALFAAAYIVLLVTASPPEGAGFSSLPAVQALFSDPAVLTAGWFHYLAFDLFVGTWIAREGLAAGSPAWALAPCLLLTFLFGPAGLLLFFILKPWLAGRASAQAGAL